MEFNMQIMDGFDYVIEEKGNTYVALRRLKWNETSEPRLDLRKYMINSDGNEVVGKGVGFSDEAANELTKVLVEQGFGETKELIKLLQDRDDYNNDVSDEEDEESYYDPREFVEVA